MLNEMHTGNWIPIQVYYQKKYIIYRYYTLVTPYKTCNIDKSIHSQCCTTELSIFYIYVHSIVHN